MTKLWLKHDFFTCIAAIFTTLSFTLQRFTARHFAQHSEAPWSLLQRELAPFCVGSPGALFERFFAGFEQLTFMVSRANLAGVSLRVR